MPFVAWHYRNGCYVRSHFRRPPWRDADSSTLPLFTPAGPPGRPAARRRRRTRGSERALRASGPKIRRAVGVDDGAGGDHRVV
jgi:hypothetical protein